MLIQMDEKTSAMKFEVLRRCVSGEVVPDVRWAAGDLPHAAPCMRS